MLSLNYHCYPFLSRAMEHDGASSIQNYRSGEKGIYSDLYSTREYDKSEGDFMRVHEMFFDL